MDKLLFYDEYEAFYAMAEKSKAFSCFCNDAYGDDFSQDEFSDIKQINRILEYVPKNKTPHILDIGCGNGKMLKYLQMKTNAFIYGIDYSQNAINTALNNSFKAEFKVGLIDEAEYSKEQFDLIISMDTIYFTNNMSELVSKIFQWLKYDGVFFAGYQEGDLMKKTNSVNSTELAQAFQKNKISYQTIDITEETYDLMKRKRYYAEKYKKDFEKENLLKWYSMLIGQTEAASVPLEEYKYRNARYLYIAGYSNAGSYF